MARIYLSTLLLMLSVLGLSQNKVLKVKILQNGEEVLPSNNVYNLKREEFTINFTSNNIEGFLVGATLDLNIYKFALENINAEISWFSNTGVADGLYNPDKSMFILDDAPSYWYYSSKRDHRFDKNPKGTPTNYISNRTISSFENLNTNQIINLKTIGQPVYLYFYNVDRDDNYNIINVENYFHGQLNFH